MDRHPKKDDHHQKHQTGLHETDGAVREELAKNQPLFGNRGDQELLHSAALALADYRECGEKDRHELQDDPDQAGDEKVGALKVGIEEKPRTHVHSRQFRREPCLFEGF